MASKDPDPQAEEGQLQVEAKVWSPDDSSGSWWDETFNPWWGCVKISPACTNCYAELVDAAKGPYFAERRGQAPVTHWGKDAPRLFQSDDYWNKPLAWNAKAKREDIRIRVFCASMCDVFEDRDELIPHRERLWRLISSTPSLDWMILTKRPENFLRFLPWAGASAPPPNVWLGVTAENQEFADQRIPILLNTSAAIRFVSYEPALGPIDTKPYLRPASGPGVDWIITGDEDTARERARDTNIDWIRSVRDQCIAAKTAFHLKQWAGHVVPGISGESDSRGKIHLPLVDGKQWKDFPDALVRTPVQEDVAESRRSDGERSEDESDTERDESSSAIQNSETSDRVSASLQNEAYDAAKASSLIDKAALLDHTLNKGATLLAVLTHHINEQCLWAVSGRYKSLDDYLRNAFGFTSKDRIYKTRVERGAIVWKYAPELAWDLVWRFEAGSEIDPDTARAAYTLAESKHQQAKVDGRKRANTKAIAWRDPEDERADSPSQDGEQPSATTQTTTSPSTVPQPPAPSDAGPSSLHEAEPNSAASLVSLARALTSALQAQLRNPTLSTAEANELVRVMATLSSTFIETNRIVKWTALQRERQPTALRSAPAQPTDTPSLNPVPASNNATRESAVSAASGEGTAGPVPSGGEASQSACEQAESATAQQLQRHPGMPLPTRPQAPWDSNSETVPPKHRPPRATGEVREPRSLEVLLQIERAHGSSEFSAHFSKREKRILREHHDANAHRMDAELATLRAKQKEMVALKEEVVDGAARQSRSSVSTERVEP